jgi:hypothetical protein
MPLRQAWGESEDGGTAKSGNVKGDQKVPGCIFFDPVSCRTGKRTHVRVKGFLRSDYMVMSVLAISIVGFVLLTFMQVL